MFYPTEKLLYMYIFSTGKCFKFYNMFAWLETVYKLYKMVFLY
jgi:hypothetical protein